MKAGEAFYADPLVDVQHLEWPDPKEYTIVGAMDEYFNRLRELLTDIPEEIWPTTAELIVAILEAIRPPYLGVIVRNRIRNGRPPNIRGPVEQWRKEANVNLRALQAVIRENAEVTAAYKGYESMHGADALHHSGQWQTYARPGGMVAAVQAAAPAQRHGGGAAALQPGLKSTARPTRNTPLAAPTPAPAAVRQTAVGGSARSHAASAAARPKAGSPAPNALPAAPAPAPARATPVAPAPAAAPPPRPTSSTRQ